MCLQKAANTLNVINPIVVHDNHGCVGVGLPAQSPLGIRAVVFLYMKQFHPPDRYEASLVVGKVLNGIVLAGKTDSHPEPLCKFYMSLEDMVYLTYSFAMARKR